MFLLLVLPLTHYVLMANSRNIVNDVLNTINNRRKQLAAGNVKEGPAGATTTLPPAKLMSKIAWDCQLEKDAIDALAKLGGTCPSTGGAGAPAGNTTNAGLYYGDDDQEEPIASIVVSKWLEEVKAKAWPGSKTGAVNTGGDTAVQNFADLMRFDTKKIGCAELGCPAGSKTVVYCLTDKPAHTGTDTIYDEETTGTGGCDLNTDCDPALDPNTICNTTTHLCEEPVASTTEASTTAESTTAASTAATTGVTTAAETTTEASYPGELPTGTNSMCPDHDGMTDELRMHFLDTQNYRRSILAKGQVQRPSNQYLPNGANIIKLKLNCPLEWEAIKEVRQCPTMKAKSTGYGKNFDTFASSTATSTFRDAIKKAVTNWWKVSRTEREGPGVNAVTFREWHVDAPVATYTQIAWANTKDIGCAIAKCSSSYTVICLYDPAGNIPEEPMYKIGAPGTACPSGTTPDSAFGLCVQN